MASKRAVATTLALLHEAFPTREISDDTANAWSAILTDVSDDQLSRATLRLCRDPERRFFPSTSEVFAAIAKETQPVDAVTVLHRIEKLGHYDPSSGWVYPTQEKVRECLGDAIADAYTVSGQFAVFSESDITRDIARRKFHDSLNDAQRRQPGVASVLALPAPKVEELVPEPPRERVPMFLAPGARKQGPLASTIEKLTAGATVDNNA